MITPTLFAIFGITNLIAGMAMGYYTGKYREREEWNKLLESKGIPPKK